VIKRRCFNDGNANKFTVPTEIKPPHALNSLRDTDHHLRGGIIIAEMMAIPGAQLWLKRFFQLVASGTQRSISEPGTPTSPTPRTRTGSDFRCLRTRRPFLGFLLMAATAFLRIVDSPHKVSFEPRQGRIENGP
jgi:hypothetical protein